MASSSQSTERIPRQEQNARQWSKLLHDSESPQIDDVGADIGPLPLLDLSKVEVRMTGLEDLSSSWKSLPDHVKTKFEEKYERIATLIRVRVQVPALKAMLSTWNPKYGVFSLNDIDTTPTIEEYQALLEIPYVVQNQIYLHLEHRQTWKAHTGGIGLTSKSI